ncbi:MAG TPA: hypothetical protein DIU42_08980 [Dermacoccus sp.]|nr:hypothetical protein [Dermacoccus sp.]
MMVVMSHSAFDYLMLALSAASAGGVCLAGAQLGLARRDAAERAEQREEARREALMDQASCVSGEVVVDDDNSGGVVIRAKVTNASPYPIHEASFCLSDEPLPVRSVGYVAGNDVRTSTAGFPGPSSLRTGDPLPSLVFRDRRNRWWRRRGSGELERLQDRPYLDPTGSAQRATSAQKFMGADSNFDF